MQTGDNLIAENSEDSHQIMQTHTAMHPMGKLLHPWYVRAAEARSISSRTGIWVLRGSNWACPTTAAEMLLNALIHYPCPFYRHDAAEHGGLAAGFSVEQAWVLLTLAYNGWE